MRGDFARYGLLTFASTTASNVLSYAFHFFVSRRLGVDNYGELSALFATTVIASVPATFLVIIVVKYAAEFRALGDDARIRALIGWITVVMGAFAVAALLLVCAASGAIAGFLHIGDRLAVVLAGFFIAFFLLSPVLRAVLQGVEDFVGFSISICIEAGGKAVVGVALVYLGFGIRGALIGWIVGVALAVAYTYFELWRRYRHAGKLPLYIDVRRLMITSARVGATTLLMTSLVSTDVLMAKHYFPASSAGLYSAASLAGKMLLYLVGFVPTVVLPMASNRAASGLRPLPVFLQGTAVLVLLAGAGLTLYATFPAGVVGALAGKAFLRAAPLVLPYGTAMVLIALLNATVNYKMAIHRFDYVVPLAIITVGEIAAIGAWHGSLQDVIRILIVGNGGAFVIALYRIGAPSRIVPKAVKEAVA
jgi:O-antigen/teichoic acid export membrane protein